jgi:DNA-binding MarR family transcriptional regulator
MKSKKLLIELIGLVDEFEDHVGDQQELSMPDFVGFLNARYSQGQMDIRTLTGGEQQQMVQEYATPEVEISRLVSVMYRYAKTYIKKALKGSVIQTADEFTFVIILMTHKSLSKTELINKNIMEKTSGTEVIKRLIKKGLITQFDYENDRRSQHVAVTDKGRQEIFTVLPDMNTVSQIVAGNLTVPERQALAYLLKKLDYHHHNIYTNHKDEELDVLVYR